MNTMSLLEPRTLYDPTTGQTYEVYTDIGGPRISPPTPTENHTPQHGLIVYS